MTWRSIVNSFVSSCPRLCLTESVEISSRRVMLNQTGFCDFDLTRLRHSSTPPPAVGKEAKVKYISLLMSCPTNAPSPILHAEPSVASQAMATNCPRTLPRRPGARTPIRAPRRTRTPPSSRLESGLRPRKVCTSPPMHARHLHSARREKIHAIRSPARAIFSPCHSTRPRQPLTDS